MVCGFTEVWRGAPTHFVEHVESGRKWHTLRWGSRWRPGLTMHLATGVRSRNYRCFREVRCELVQGVKIIPTSTPGALPRVMVERGPRKVLEPLVPFELLALAINDGFDSPYVLNAWMLEACKANKLEAFRGQIVMWNPVGQPSNNLTPY